MHETHYNNNHDDDESGNSYERNLNNRIIMLYQRNIQAIRLMANLIRIDPIR